jgi:NADPH:quinone reductase-like Zn-dependent oxidoreductase
MQAVRVHQHGGPEVLMLEEAPKAAITKADQVLVRMRAAALNHLDLWVRKGLPGIPLPITMGSDGAGVIEEIGKDVRDWAAGDDVVIQPGTFCGQCPVCQTGRENLCPNYGILGESQDGVQAELVALPERNVSRKPAQLNFEEASSFGLVFLTAYQMLVKRARLEAGETVLVIAGSSGVGAAAIQIGVQLGAKVIATAAGGDKYAFAKSMGAREVVDHYQPNWYRQVLDLAGPGRVQVVVEHVGAATWEQSSRTLGIGGRLVFCGATTGADVSINLRHAFRKQQAILGSTMGDMDSFEAVVRGFEAGHYKPIVDKVFPLNQIGEAHRYLESGRHHGKIVVAIPGEN